MSLPRLPNWEERLYNRLEVYRDRPFEWGVHDCATCAADLIERITGEDLMGDLRDCYDSEKTALKAIKKAGYDSLEDLVTSRLTPLDSIYQGHRGDVVLCDVKGKRFLAVKTGSVAVAPGKTGLMHIDFKYWVRVWRV